MKKLHVWLGAAACLFGTASINAQPDVYFHLNGNYDHGTTTQVIRNLAGNGYVMSGTANIPLPNNTPGIFIGNYTNAGVPIWGNIIPITTGVAGPGNFASATSIAASPALGRYGVLAFTNATSPQQLVLVQTNGAGVPIAGLSTPLGDYIGYSVIWDATNNQWAVLAVAPTNNGDFRLIRINPAGAVIGSNTYDSGPGNADRPSRMIQDPATGNYTLVGTAGNAAGSDVFVVRTTPFGGLICSETFGDPLVKEIGVDVTYGRTLPGPPNEIVLGQTVDAAGQPEPFIIEIDPLACPSFKNSIRLIGNKPNNVPRAITTVTTAAGMSYAICGRQADGGNDNGFVMMVNQALNGTNYIRYGQPAQPGNEYLTDVEYDATTARIIFSGDHQRLVMWGNSPANQFYPWLLMTNPVGLGACPEVPGINSTGYPLVKTSHFFTGAFAVSVPVNVFSFTIAQTFIDECAFPFRLAAPDEPGATATLFPNPASSQLSIAYTAPGTDAVTFELMNMLGETVMSKQLPADAERAEINVDELPAGLYMYRISSGDIEMAADKLMIQH
jgi:hypothetical protein